MRKALIASFVRSPPRSRRRDSGHGRSTAPAPPRRSPAARRTSSACSTRRRRSRSAPTTRPTRRGSAATRRRSRGRSATRTAARATSRPSRTRSRSSSASRRRRCKWTVVPFNNSFRPGQEAVRLLHHPGLVHARSARRPSTSRSATTSSTSRSSAARASRSRRRSRSPALKNYKLGAQIGTTSYDYIVKYDQAELEADSSTTRTTRRCRRSRTARSTASSSTCRPRSTSPRVQVPDGKIVGQLPTRGHQGALRRSCFQKGSPLTACVNKALDRLWANGTIKKLQQTWLAEGDRRARPEVAA